ncbi:unnamed protein product [Heligmosomoides polygyrus]|uniref:HECT-type E3 ubiquitin transferase n=1 Tax=Heligmosomoides polygyrus TaxID=6339 RepID=A0A183FIC9_HELPZ|nr:unnamed protein product [Heligmosomoides polygyrus]
MLGGRRLCAFDELSQLDPELYRNLTFVKKYDGDINTVELAPGGRTIQVTNDNKIDYVHRMAHHRVFSQTEQQCRAFVTGAQSVLNPAWLFLFAPYELQFIISGYIRTFYCGKCPPVFLQFVTSCSRPPLLGLSYLEPPFSIRCVEVLDDQIGGWTYIGGHGLGVR